MISKITVAIDSFKGSLSSLEASSAVEQGIRAVLPHCHVLTLPIADGGEGTVEALVQALGGELCEVRAHDALMRPITSHYLLLDNGTTAIIEMSAASGLTLLSHKERNPWLATSYGTGELIAHALGRGARRLLIGIGGSATNDAGMGMLEALGYSFYDSSGHLLAGCGARLERVATIDSSKALKQLEECQITVACDVENPLYGPMGAAYVFAPQKGADAAMVERLDRGLRNFARVVNDPMASCRGAGAAGGMGYTLCAVLGAQLQSGIDTILQVLDFKRRIADSDLIITGEGCIDQQSLMGKSISGVLRMAQECQIPVVAIGGKVVECEALRRSGFAAILPIVQNPTSLAEAMHKPTAEANIRRTVEHLIRQMSRSSDSTHPFAP